MKERIVKASKRYREKYLTDERIKKNEGCFFLNDTHEVVKIMETQKFSMESICNAIRISQEAGFMIGYEKAMRDIKKKNISDQNIGTMA